MRNRCDSSVLWLTCCAAALIATIGFSSTAFAITAYPQQACIPGSANFAPGWADTIDAGNADRTDDAVVCVDQFNAANNIALNNTAAFQNELANVGSHELGHLVGLAHGDGGAATLMTVVFPFSGADRAFGSPAEQAKLNALAAPVQIVWLDFLAAQPGLHSKFRPWTTSAELANHAINNAAQIAAAQAAIVAQIVADYAGPWTNGATFAFYTTAAAASAAAVASGQAAGAYSTVSFVAIPEPSTALLVLAGTLLVTARRRNRTA